MMMTAQEFKHLQQAQQDEEQQQQQQHKSSSKGQRRQTQKTKLRGDAAAGGDAVLKAVGVERPLSEGASSQAAAAAVGAPPPVALDLGRELLQGEFGELCATVLLQVRLAGHH
jgi:hypothetical protein